MIIRSAQISDAPHLLAIYTPYVQNTAISFEYDPPSLTEFESRICTVTERFPYLVAEDKGEILGYAYAAPFHPRKAFMISAEVSIYIDTRCRRNGIGQALYRELERRLKDMGITNMYALIAYCPHDDPYLPKDSVHFHEKMGFVLRGHLQQCGLKFDRWYDMYYMEKMIAPHAPTEVPTRQSSH